MVMILDQTYPTEGNGADISESELMISLAMEERCENENSVRGCKILTYTPVAARKHVHWRGALPKNQVQREVHFWLDLDCECTPDL
jgi:hypothetical protein